MRPMPLAPPVTRTTLPYVLVSCQLQRVESMSTLTYFDIEKRAVIHLEYLKIVQERKIERK
jgi:hypothetical protein